MDFLDPVLIIILLLFLFFMLLFLLLLLLLLLHCSCCYNIIGTVFVTVNKLGLGLKSVIYIYLQAFHETT